MPALRFDYDVISRPAMPPPAPPPATPMATSAAAMAKPADPRHNDAPGEPR